MAIIVGQNLGKYTILEKLGEGGMATVYKARDTRLDRFVAIKVIRTGADLEENFRQRFEREARALAQLTHPNIVNIIDYGEQDGVPYLVMEYIPSGTLKEQTGRPMPWREAVKLLLPIARALEYAHKQGIVHRDIKPSNILITASGEPMLSDFGIARMLEGGATRGLTTTGMAIGTPEYMAPEQLMEGSRGDEDSTHVLKDVSRAVKAKGEKQAIDGRADEYALGVVLYELITGRTPYRADTPVAVGIKQATEPLPLPRKFITDLPEGVEMLLVKALAKQREDRYASLGEMAEGMETLLQGAQAEGKKKQKGGQGKKKDQRETKPTSGRKRPPLWVYLAGGIGLAGLIAAIIFLGLIGRMGMGPMRYLASDTPMPTSTYTITVTRIPTNTKTSTITPTKTVATTRTPTIKPSSTATLGPPETPMNFRVISSEVSSRTEWGIVECHVEFGWDQVHNIDGYIITSRHTYFWADSTSPWYGHWGDSEIDKNDTSYMFYCEHGSSGYKTSIDVYIKSYRGSGMNIIYSASANANYFCSCK